MNIPKKAPLTLDLDRTSHRVMLLRAYHALLSEGLDEPEAKAGAGRYALQNWEELQEE